MIAGGAVALACRPARARLTGVLAAAGLALIVGVVRLARDDAAPGLQAAPQPVDGPPLVVVTLNVWSGNRSQPVTAARLMASGAHVLAIQEPHGLQKVQTAVRRAFPYEAGCPRLGDCGAVILSRQPILRSGVIPRAGGLTSANEFGLAWAEVVAPDGRPVTVLSAHLDWPIPQDRQAREVAGLLKTIEALPPGDVIVAGDLNLTPWSHTLQELDRKLSPLTRRTRGLATYPDLSAYGMWPPALPVLPLDHLYAPPSMRLRKIERLAGIGSDHLGVRAEFTRDLDQDTR